MIKIALLTRHAALPVLIALALSGCTAERLNREGLKQINEGQYEEGVAKLQQAAKADPANLHYKSQFLTKREEAVNSLLNSAANERAAGHLEAANQLYQRVLTIAPENKRAASGLDELIKDHRHQAALDEAHTLYKNNEFDEALVKLQPALIENPINKEVLALKRAIEEQQTGEALTVPSLKSLYKKPITLEFRDANLKMVFELLSHTSGINFILDKDVRADLTTTIFVKRGSLDNVVDLLLSTSQLAKKVVDANTVLIYPNTPEKLREYQELMVKSFYIENADVKQTMNMVKMLLKTREIFVDEKLNMMIMRDTPDTIRLAEKLILMQDLAEPEVMLEVEVLEVTRSRLLNLGVKYPNQLTLAPLAGAGGALTLTDLKNLNSSRLSAGVTNLVINAQNDDSDINLLANPRIRTRNREQAKIMIGDRVPVITTTSTATGFVSDSVQYVDVGLKLDVQPTIYLHDEVAIKVSMEVSSIANQVTSKNGTLAYQIGSRTASTVLRLKDGETQVLAGLINDNDRATASKVPGLGDLPLLGRLFSTRQTDKQKTEIVLSITPHLVRSLKRPDARASEFWSGSETILRASPLALQRPKTPTPTVNAVKPSVQPDPVSTTQAPAVKENKAEVPEVNPTESPTAISLAWQGPKQVKPGEQFQVTLMLKADGGLRSLPFQLGYNPAALKVVDVVEGEFFKQNGVQTSFPNTVDIETGKIFVGVVRAGNEGAAGENSLATITFKALTPQAKTEVKLLAATPIGVGDKTPRPDMPDAYAVTIGD